MRASLRRLLVQSIVIPLSLLAAAPAAQAQLFCVYDPLGSQGDFFSVAKDYQLAAKRWGLNIDLKAYTDDDALYAAFKSGQCDMGSMIGMRAREFNKFTGTIDAPSVIENYVQMREVLNLMASPKLAKVMVSGNYEMVGMIPIGNAYPVVSDRSINSFEHANGKKVAVMGWDKTQSLMAEWFHVIPVPTTLPAYGPSFNTGKVDLIIAPMVIYKAMELSKGIGTKGGIVRRPLFSFTMQMISHTDKFPAEFGQKSREYMNTQTDHALGIIRNQEAVVDNRLWIYAVHSELVEWNIGMRKLLNKLVEQGHFDSRMISILQRIRCKTSTDDSSCTASPSP
jgi:ABC-type amino acid transport substrate-binding protein